MDQLNNEYELLVAKEKELEKLLNDNLTSEETDNLKDKLNINQKTENITTSNTNKSLDKSIIEKINN